MASGIAGPNLVDHYPGDNRLFNSLLRSVTLGKRDGLVYRNLSIASGDYGVLDSKAAERLRRFDIVVNAHRAISLCCKKRGGNHPPRTPVPPPRRTTYYLVGDLPACTSVTGI